MLNVSIFYDDFSNFNFRFNCFNFSLDETSEWPLPAVQIWVISEGHHKVNIMWWKVYQFKGNGLEFLGTSIKLQAVLLITGRFFQLLFTRPPSLEYPTWSTNPFPPTPPDLEPNHPNPSPHIFPSIHSNPKICVTSGTPMPISRKIFVS